MDLYTSIGLFLFSIVSAFIGSTVGGTGLIRLPLLVLLGLSPVSSIGTSKLASVVGAAIAMREYRKKKLVKWDKAKPLILFCVIGVVIGAFIAISINQELLKSAMGFFIVLFVLFNLIKSHLGIDKIKIKRKMEALIFLPLCTYQGFLGAGAGTVLTLLMMTLYDLKFLEASATKLVFVIVGGGVSGAIFLSAGAIDFQVWAIMIAGGSIGNTLGPRFAIRTGEKWMKPIFYAMSLFMGLAMFI